MHAVFTQWIRGYSAGIYGPIAKVTMKLSGLDAPRPVVVDQARTSVAWSYQ
jgi:hypothetical protein